MKIALLEPLGVSADRIAELARPLEEAGHTFTYYDTKTTDVDELARRSADANVVMIANNPYPARDRGRGQPQDDRRRLHRHRSRGARCLPRAQHRRL